MKKSRHADLIEIIESQKIQTQEELLQLLRQRGYDVTQATVSRDIKALRLIKLTDSEGSTRYSLPHTGTVPKEIRRYHTILKETIYQVAPAGNLVVIRCYVGMANAAAAAFDALNFENVVGTIAGDDTIFVAINTPGNALDLQQKLEQLL